jgi:regulator of replication initiation timing
MTPEINVIHDLRDHIAQCHAELAAMDDECARLKAENTRLRAQLDTQALEAAAFVERVARSVRGAAE